MPTLFQYAIFFLAALLCISLVLCVREGSAPATKDKTPATPPADKAVSPAQSTAAPLQRIEPRGVPDGSRIGEPAFPRALSRAADPAAAPLQRSMAPTAREPQAPLLDPLQLSMAPAARDTRTPLLRTLAPLAGETSHEGPGAAASPLHRTAPAPVAQPTLLRMIEPAAPAVPSMPAGPSGPVGAVRDPASTGATAAAQRIGLGGEDAAARGGAPAGGLRIDDMPAPVSERDRALDQRNDTLWDLVVHLRDYVEQLRAERHTLHDEARQLRAALAEAAEEVRLLRAAQAAANSNEQSAAAADARPGEATRVGAGPQRLH